MNPDLQPDDVDHIEEQVKFKPDRASWIEKSAEDVDRKKGELVPVLANYFGTEEEAIKDLLIVEKEALRIEGPSYKDRAHAISTLLRMTMDVEKNARNKSYFSSTVASYQEGIGAQEFAEIYIYRIDSMTTTQKDGRQLTTPVPEADHMHIIKGAVLTTSKLSRDMGSIVIPEYSA